MDSHLKELEIITNGIEVQNTIGFAIFDKVDPLDHPALYSFAKIIYNYVNMSKKLEKENTKNF